MNQPTEFQDSPRQHIHLKNMIASCFVLAVGVGFAGSLMHGLPIQHFAWAISSFFMIIGASLLSSKLTRAGHDIPAAGFIVLSIGQATSYAFIATHDAGVEQFGAVIAIFIPSLILISMYNIVPLSVRIAGFISAATFASLAACIYQEVEAEWVQPVFTTAAYLTMNFVIVGWAWLIYREKI
ncbi:MAG: hypothetical protein ABJC12_07435 [Saprospiraceae bacterium]